MHCRTIKRSFRQTVFALPIFILVLSKALPLAAQPMPSWTHTYEAEEPNEFLAIIEAHGGWSFAGAASGEEAYWYGQIGHDGGLQWDTATDADAHVSFHSIVSTSGGYVLGGDAYDSLFDGYHANDSASADGVIASIDMSGNIRWAHCYGGSGNDVLSAVAKTYDGGYVLIGSTSSNDGDVQGYHEGTGYGTSYDVWVEKIDSIGNVVWERTLGGSGNDVGVGIAELTDHTLGAVATTQSSDGDVSHLIGSQDLWIINLDSNGNLLWQQTFGTPGNDLATGIAATPDGYMIVTGSVSDTGSAGVRNALWIAKMASGGFMFWQNDGREWNGYDPHAMAFTPDGNVLLGGRVLDQNNVQRTWIAKIDGTYGHELWRNNYSFTTNSGQTSINPTINAIAPSMDGGFAVAGYSAFDTSGVDKGFVARFQADHSLSILTEETSSTDFQVFPIPASNQITMQYEATDANPTQIRVYNGLGICVLHSDELASRGINAVTLNVSSLPRGVYYMEITVDGSRESRAFVLQ